MNTTVDNHFYNEELKRKFLNSADLSKSGIQKYEHFFEQTCKWEKQYNTDLCRMNDIKMLQEVFDSMSGVSYRSAHTIKSIFKRYIDWCIQEAVEGAVDITNKIVMGNPDVFKETMVQSPMYMQKFLNEVFMPENTNTADNTYRCLFWLAYSGMRSSDALLVKTGDVDFNTMSVKYNGTSYPLYKEAIPAFKNCVELKSFTYINPRYTSVLPRYNSDQLLRGIKADMTLITVKSYMSRKVSASNAHVKLTYDKARMSGIYYRMYEQEVYGVELDYPNLALKYMSEKEYHFKNKYSYQRLKNTIARGFADDYRKWKTAFNL